MPIASKPPTGGEVATAAGGGHPVAVGNMQFPEIDQNTERDP
jgi:hypothetical protein